MKTNNYCPLCGFSLHLASSAPLEDNCVSTISLSDSRWTHKDCAQYVSFWLGTPLKSYFLPPSLYNERRISSSNNYSHASHQGGGEVERRINALMHAEGFISPLYDCIMPSRNSHVNDLDENHSAQVLSKKQLKHNEIQRKGGQKNPKSKHSLRSEKIDTMKRNKIHNIMRELIHERLQSVGVTQNHIDDREFRPSPMISPSSVPSGSLAIGNDGGAWRSTIVGDESRWMRESHWKKRTINIRNDHGPPATCRFVNRYDIHEGGKDIDINMFDDDKLLPVLFARVVPPSNGKNIPGVVTIESISTRSDFDRAIKGLRREGLLVSIQI